MGRGGTRIAESRRCRSTDPCVPAGQRGRTRRARQVTADERSQDEPMVWKEFARKVLRGQWPILLVGLFFLAAFGLVIAGYWRRGALVLGIGVAAAAALRIALTDDRAGLLMVRTKGVDFVTTATVSAIVLYIAATIDPLGTS